MTLQVALKGIDGVVLASDTKWSEVLNGVRQTFNRSKIVVDHDRRIAVACARDMDISAKTAQVIIAEIGDRWSTLHIEEIAENVRGKMPKTRNANCLIVSPTLRIFRLETIRDDSGENPRSVCSEHLDRAYAGQDVSAAIFWAERYYCQWQSLKLIPLAAFLINAGNKLDPAGIEGLEIVLCDASGIHRLSNDSINVLQSWANNTDEVLRTSFGNYDKHFTYDPHESKMVQ